MYIPSSNNKLREWYDNTNKLLLMPQNAKSVEKTWNRKLFQYQYEDWKSFVERKKEGH